MKSVVLDTMKYSLPCYICVLIFSINCFSQEKREFETRIKSREFPQKAHEVLQPHLKEAKKIRFYEEVDGKKNSFEAKFKKGKLFYSVEFDSTGQLEDVEFIIKKVDVPDSSWQAIESYLKENLGSYRIKKIQQQHPIQSNDATKTLKEALQNLILPYINYELIVAGKTTKGYLEYEILFDNEGVFISSRRSLPEKYDHVLY